MANIFKNIGRGVGYFFAFPFLLVAIALYAVFGLIVFLIQFIKLIILFFTGRTLFSDLPEDIELRAKMTKDEPKEEDQVVEVKEDKQLSLYPSDSVVYGSGYASPMFADKKEQEPEKEEDINKVEEEPSPEIEVEAEDNEEGGNI